MRATVLFATALLVVGAAAPLAAAGVGADAASTGSSVVVQEDDAANESEGTETAPGAQLAGVVDVQAAEVEGEIERRAFGLQVAAANSNASKASVVADHVEDLDGRLAELRDRKQELRDARENGSISESRYRAEMAGVAARISTLQRLTNETTETARDIPAGDLAERGVNESDLDRLRAAAGNLSGPEVASIARDVAGPPGNDTTAGPPFDEDDATGPPTDTPATPGDEGNGTTAGQGNGPDDPGDADDDEPVAPGRGDSPGNSSGASGDQPGADGTAGNGTDNPGNGENDEHGPSESSVLAPLSP